MSLENNSFINYTKDEIKVIVRADLDPIWVDKFIAEHCENKSGNYQAETLYNKRNKISRFTDPILERDIAVKEFHLEKKYDQLRFRFLDSKAVRSLKIARALQEIGLLTPEPLAVIEKRAENKEIIYSYYITNYLNYDFNLLDIAKKMDHPERYKVAELMPQLAAELKRMHAAGIVHNDLHAGNILVKNFSNQPEIFYIDLNRGRIKTDLARKEKIADLKRLKLTTHEQKIFLKEYAGKNWQGYQKELQRARARRRTFVKLKRKVRNFFN